MKRFSTIALMLLLVVAFSLPASASADTSPGVKPGSFFYFLDTTFEKIGLFFTFSSEGKARKALEYADERLAEAEAVTEDAEAVKIAITNYESNIAFAEEKSKDVGNKEKAEALFTSIADNTSKHQKVLTNVLAKVPDEAKEAITRAIEVSRKGHEEAMQKIAELKGEVEKLKQEVAKLRAKDEKREKIIKEINKQGQEIKSTPVKPSISNNQQDAPTTVKLSNLNSFIDAAIEYYEDNIDYANQIINAIDFYEKNLQEGKSLISDIINHETDQYWSEKWQMIDKYGSDAINLYEKDKNSTLTDIKSMENNISNLKKEKEKNLLSEPVSVEQYWVYYDKLKGEIMVEQFATALKNRYENFDPSAKTIQSQFSSMMWILINKEVDYYKTLVDTYGELKKVYQPSSISSQPITYPTYPAIKMPQTTHCTLSGDGGVGLQAYINCTTY